VVLEACRNLGFAASGIASAGPSGFARELASWLERGMHGTMEYMSRDVGIRLDPRGLLEGTTSFIMVADQYASRGDGVAMPRGHGRIARYARGRNYHEVIRRRLHRLADALRERIPGSEFRTFVDTAPVLERELAQLAGLGWHAKNTMLIHPRLGSYLLLGGIATNVRLAVPATQMRVTDHCGTCTRCIDACPTAAITPLTVDARRCISYLTIEHRGEIAHEFHGAMGSWIYGCDVCQEVCPHNSARGEEIATPTHPDYAPRAASIALLDVLGWSEQSRGEAIQTTAMKRASLEMMKRNALIAAGNALREGADAGLEARVREIAADEAESELVRNTAASVASGLGPTAG
jgi:epoxyqueuosine reductase